MGRHVHSDQLCRRQPGRIRGRVHHRRRRRARHHANGDAVCASVVDDRALQSCHRRRSRAGRQRSGLCHHSGGELALTRERNLRQQARRPTDADLGSGDLTRFLRRRDRRGSLSPTGDLFVTGGTLHTLGAQAFGQEDAFIMENRSSDRRPPLGRAGGRSRLGPIRPPSPSTPPGTSTSQASRWGAY